MLINEIKDFISLKTIIYELDFLKKAVIIQLHAWKRIYLLLLSNKFIENIPDPRHIKEHYQSLIVKINRKSVKQLEILTYQPRTFQNPEIVDKKSAIREYRKTSYKLSKTIRQAKKLNSNSSLYSDTKRENFLNEKNAKITKQEHAFKGMQVLILLKV